VDIYIYDSQNFLIFQTVLRRTPEIGLQPEDFPITVTWTPSKTDLYSVKLWVVHEFPGAGHRQAYLEDTTTFRVIPYVTTTFPATTSLVIITRTVVTTTTTRTTTSITTVETEMIKVDWVMILIVLVAVAISFSIFAAFDIGKRKGRESRVALEPTRTR